ncbi:helix-turn-helix domain-containing protein [Sphingobacterium siyangense]|uniref:helix-turn-helix domain-containing protein n=1 Tax=Sphingobacterium siyangense TaxID=459529 RepID=UPI003DA35E71
MEINIVTKDDLEEFRVKLLSEIREILKIQEVKSFPRSIKTKQVLEILDISAGKLQQMRIAGELSYKKVGGTYYYNYNEVKRLLPKELNGGNE